MFEKAKSKAAEVAMMDYKVNTAIFASQAPTEHLVTAQNLVDKLTCEVIANMDGDLAGNLENLGYDDKDDASKNEERKLVLTCCNPFLLHVTEAVRAAAYTVTSNVSKGVMEDYCNYAVEKDKEHSNDRLTAKFNITQLQSQVAALTSAVAETAQTEHDKKLRLRNLNKAITTQPNQDGTSDQKRENKDKREGELRTWLNKLFPQLQSFHH